MDNLKQEENYITDTNPIFNPSLDQDQRFREHWDLFLKFESSRNQNIKFFNKNGSPRNLLQYVSDSVDRMNEFRLKPSYKEPWQNNVFEPVTRDKIMTIIGRLASSRMKAEVITMVNNIFNNKDTEFRRAVLSDLLENANIHNQEELQLVWEIYTCATEGTVIGYEGWMRDMREREIPTDMDPDTGEIKTTTTKYAAWDDVYGEIIPIDEWYPETIHMNIRDFRRKMKRCFWAREMTMLQFQDKYGRFPASKDVKPAGFYTKDQLNHWGVKSDVNKENVFVMEYFDVAKYRYGIWSNGTELSYGAYPFLHGELPIWISIAEPIHHQFLYGKSFPDKLMTMQDVNDSLINSMLDQLLLALNSPIFVDGEIDNFDDGYLEPGRVYTTTPGATVQRSAMGQVDQTAFQMLSLIKRSLESSSTSDQSQGIATGGRKTKFEVQQLQEGALQIASLLLQIMETAMAHKYRLRIYNILQYYSMPSQKKSGKKQFKYIELDNRKLTNGKTGKKIIQIVGSDSQLPKPEELAGVASSIEGKAFDPVESTVEPIAITRDFLLNREIELDIRIVANSSVKTSQAEKDSKAEGFYMNTLQDSLVNHKEALKSYAKAMGQDEDVVGEQAPAPQADPMAQIMSGTGGGQPAPTPEPQGQPDFSQLGG